MCVCSCSWNGACMLANIWVNIPCFTVEELTSLVGPFLLTVSALKLQYPAQRRANLYLEKQTTDTMGVIIDGMGLMN